MLKFNELPLRLTLTIWIVFASFVALSATFFVSCVLTIKYEAKEQADSRQHLYQTLVNIDPDKFSALSAYLLQQTDLKAAALRYPNGDEYILLADTRVATVPLPVSLDTPSVFKYSAANVLEMAHPLYDEKTQKPILYLYTATDISRSIGVFRQQHLIELAIFVIVGLIGIVAVTSVLRKRVTRPLEVLAQNAGLISRGEYNVLSNYSGRNEIGRLAKSLNSIGREAANHVESIESRNQQLTTFLNSGLIAMLVENRNGTFIEVNEHWLDISGWSRTDMGELSWQRLIHTDSLAEFNEFKGQLTLDAAQIEVDLKINHKSGQARWVHLVAKQLYLLDTDAPVNLYYVRDIQANKTHEQEIKLAAVAFETHEAILVTDEKATILKVNSAFTRITGYAPEEVIGQNARILQSGQHDRHFYRDMWSQLLADKTWEGEIWNQKKNGIIYPQWETITAVTNDQGEVVKYVACFHDISEKKRAEEEIKKLAYYDDLTGLPNRRMFYKRLHQVVAHCRRTNSMGALLFIDLDHFKDVNDSLGHLIGDKLLVENTFRLNDIIRTEDTLARLGGDEFVIMMEQIGDDYASAAAAAHMLAERIITQLSQPVILGKHTVKVTASVGISIFPTDSDNINDLLRQADTAMYKSKEAGRATVRFFSKDMQLHASSRMQLRTDLEQAVLTQQFCLALQPQVNVSTGKIYGVEALIRWRHPQQGMLMPGDFLSIAEESDLIIEIGKWTLIEACRLQQQFSEQGLEYGRISVNIDPKHFHRPNFVEEVLTIIRMHKGLPERLCLEITEGVAIDNLENASAKIEALQQAGIWVAIDDFGTGYSSLSYLINLRAKELKLDRSFILELEEKHEARVMVKSILSLAEKLGFHVVAEGVETEKQRLLLDDLGCFTFQGYFESRPLLLDDFIEYLNAKNTVDTFCERLLLNEKD